MKADFNISRQEDVREVVLFSKWLINCRKGKEGHVFVVKFAR
jgi:hypothetical protein